LQPYDGRSVSFAIMAHPRRAQWAVDLGRELDCEIIWDKHNDRHETGLRAIKAYDAGATHHCVIQDDAILCKDFKPAVSELIKYPKPLAPVGLYYGAKGVSATRHSSIHSFATSKNAKWIIRKGPVWGPGIIYPRKTVRDLVRFYENSEIQNYDRRVMRFYESINESCWYTIPSLVDHRQEDNASLCAHDRPNRQARLFCGPQSALELRWDGPAVRSKL